MLARSETQNCVQSCYAHPCEGGYCARRSTSSLHTNLLKEGCRGKFADHKTNVLAAGGSAGGEGRQPCLGGEAVGIVCSGGLNSAKSFMSFVISVLSTRPGIWEGMSESLA